MIGRHLRTLLLALAVCPLTAPSVQACGLWNKWFGTPTTTFYAPYTASYAPAGCGQTVNYMPQTCFRSVIVNAPVVAYRPETACDACGRATTVMRPVVSYVQQTRLVPYTTFRPVVTATPVAGCCGRPAVAAFAPAVAMPAVTSATYAAPIAPAAPAAGCCGANVAPSLLPGASVPSGTPGASVPSLAPSLNYAPSTSAPTTTTSTYPPATAYPQPTYPATTPPATSPYPQQSAPPAGTLQPQPDPTGPPATTPQKTFDNGEGKPAPESRLLLPPRTEPATTGGTLRGLDPEVQDRITAIPLRGSYSIRTASAVSVARPAAPAQVDNAWRSARP